MDGNRLVNWNFSEIRGPKKTRPIPGCSGDVFEPWQPYWMNSQGRDQVPWDPSNSSGWFPPEWQVVEVRPPFVDESGLVLMPDGSNIIFTDWKPIMYPPETRKRDRGPRRPWRMMDKFSQGVFASGKVYCAGLLQTISSTPGERIMVSCQAHAWSNLNIAPDPTQKKQSPDVQHSGDPMWSTAIGEIGYRQIMPDNWPNIRSTGDTLEDARSCMAFRCGIDVSGQLSPFAGSVVWGKWTAIYNVFGSVEPAIAIASGASVTCFFEVLCRWPFPSNCAYWARMYAAPMPPDPPPPVEKHVIVAHLAPPDATLAEKYKVVDIAHIGRDAILQSIPDTASLVGSGAAGSKVVVWAQGRYPQGALGALSGLTVETREFSGDPEPPPPPPPSISYKRPTSMAGVHISHGGRTGYHDWLVNCQKSVFVKSFMDFGALMEAKTVNPNTITVIRVLPEQIGEDTPPENWQWELSRTRWIAQDWMSKCYPILDRNGRQWFDYVEVINEPDPSDAPAMERAADFVQYCMEDAEQHGYKLAIWSWAAGLPRTPRLRAGEFNQMERTLETLKHAAEHGHALAVHEGGLTPERRLLRQAAEGMTALRYRVTEQLMDEKGWPMPAVVVTEAYQESGYKAPNWDDWKWYWNELAQDPYVLGSAWFTLGDWEFGGGQNVNIVGQLRNMAIAIASLPEVVSPVTPPPVTPPPPPPPPPPPATEVGPRGLHMRPDGELRESDYECIRFGKIKYVKLTTGNPPWTVDRLAGMGIQREDVIVRLFVDLRDRIVAPAEFIDWMNLPIAEFMARGVRYFEIHNEPNHPSEGMGLSWHSAAEFAGWYGAVLAGLRTAHPGARLGFPGLWPDPSADEFVNACDAMIREADWIGAHAYWVDPALMGDVEHGGYWRRVANRYPDKLVMIVEFSNPSPDISMRDKGAQYKAYWASLPAAVPAFCFISSSYSFPFEAWVDESERISGVREGLA